jgi:hypothetical protein
MLWRSRESLREAPEATAPLIHTAVNNSLYHYTACVLGAQLRARLPCRVHALRPGRLLQRGPPVGEVPAPGTPATAPSAGRAHRLVRDLDKSPRVDTPLPTVPLPSAAAGRAHAGVGAPASACGRAAERYAHAPCHRERRLCSCADIAILVSAVSPFALSIAFERDEPVR